MSRKSRIVVTSLAFDLHARRRSSSSTPASIWSRRRLSLRWEGVFQRTQFKVWSDVAQVRKRELGWSHSVKIWACRRSSQLRGKKAVRSSVMNSLNDSLEICGRSAAIQSQTNWSWKDGRMDDLHVVRDTTFSICEIVQTCLFKFHDCSRREFPWCEYRRMV